MFDGLNLGFWVSTQRATSETMSEQRRARLEEIGFIWDAKGDYWEEGLAKLKQQWTQQLF